MNSRNLVATGALAMVLLLGDAVSVVAQERSLLVEETFPQTEIGVHGTGIFAGTAQLFGLGGRVTRVIDHPFSFEFGIDSRFGRSWLYFLEAKQTLINGNRTSIFATYGAAGLFERDRALSSVSLPVLPVVGLGTQRVVAKYAALRFEGQLMFGVLQDSRPVIGRLSVGISVPVGGY